MMKHKILAFFALTLLTNACGISKGTREGTKSGASDQTVESRRIGYIEVLGERARIFFVINQKQGFVWDAGARGRLEWEWRALLELNKSSYEIGFSRKSHGGNTNQGSLAELLAAGDFDIRLSEDEKDKVNIVSEKVEINLLDQGLLMEVIDDDFVDLWLKDKPQTAIFRMAGIKQESTALISMPITYK